MIGHPLYPSAAPPYLCNKCITLAPGLGGVGLELVEEGGAHSPIPEFFQKLFPVATKQQRLLLTSIDWDCVDWCLVNSGRTMASTIFSFV